jgi:glycosyltransferase involved in cell wall biosynthesis
MSNTTSLEPKTLEQLKNIKKADILVGIPSYNNESTIGHVIKAVKVGLTKFFPECRSVVVHSDCGSTDGTRDVVRKTLEETDAFESILISHEKHPFVRNLHIPIEELETTFRGAPGKGKAFRRVFDIAAALDVKAVVVVDSDLRSITPEWIQLLAAPILTKGYDYVAPFYSRHKFDGFITNTIVYPLTRALYGKKIRQPIGGEFGFSRRVLGHYTDQNIWDTDVAYFGIDIWMTTNALTNGFNVCQSFLGAKIHNPRGISSLVPMFKQVVGTLFAMAEENAGVWKKINGSSNLPIFGFRAKVIPEEIPADPDLAFRNFHVGADIHRSAWQKILGPASRREIDKIAALPKKEFQFPISVWVKVVYDYVLFFHKLKNGRKKMNESLFYESLVPLYFGFLASFIKTIGGSNEDAEAEIEQICLEYENLKSYLVKNWEMGK